MFTCTFIGHKDAPADIMPILETAIRDLITNKKVSNFYVGTHGSFDFFAQTLLNNLKREFPHINYTVVLAYLTEKSDAKPYPDSIFPVGLENVPPRFAIDRRNRWMIKNSDYLICYVCHPFSNSHKFKEYAERQNKTIINLATNAKSGYEIIHS